MRDDSRSAEYEKVCSEKPPPHKSWVLAWLNEEKRKQKDSQAEKKGLEPEHIGLQEDDHVSHREVEEVPGAGVETAALHGVDAADDGDKGPPNDDGGSIVYRKRETTAQVSSIDFRESLTASVEARIYGLLFAPVTILGWLPLQPDFQTAFPQVDLDGDIYKKQPQEPESAEEPEEPEQHGAREEAVDGAHKAPVCHNSDERLSEGTSGQSVDDSEQEALNETSTMRGDRDDHEQALHNPRDETGNHDNQALDGTCEEVVASDPDNQFHEGIHEEPGNGNRDKKSINGHCEEPVVNEGEGTFEGTREETVDDMREEAAGGGDLVPSEHDEPPSNGSREVTITGTLQASSSRREHEGQSESQFDPPKCRGKTKYLSLPTCNTLTLN